MRQAGGVAKAIWKPEDFHIQPKFSAKKLLAVIKLPEHAFAADEVGVHLYPSGALHLPTAGLHSRFDTLVKLRGPFLDPAVELRLRCAEDIIRVFLQVV